MSRLFRLAIALPLALAVATQAHAAEPEARGGDWWRVDYVGDYLSVGASLGMMVGFRLSEPNPAAFGPVYDPEHWQGILDPAHRKAIGKPHREDTVPGWGLGVFAGVGAVGILLQEGIAGANGMDEVDWQIAHDSMLGYTEAITWSLAITEAFKVGVGRLRPDFQDRVRRYHCGHLRSQDPVCDGWSGEPLEESVIAAGRRSFISGHSSFSFAVATYWSLVIGGRMVWGERADSTSMALGVLLQTGLLAIASWVTASRVSDGRHHIEDVIAGAAIGFASAHGAYWRHFGTDGLPRERSGKRRSQAPGGPRSQGLGISMGGTF